MFTLNALHLNFTQFKLCLATATHSFNWVKIIYIYLFWKQTFANLDI